MSKPTIKALFILLLCTVVYHWKILLTHDYSLVIGWEEVSHLYSWLQFWVTTLRSGALPLWDPYAFAGHPFGGEMQTAVFYPVHLLLALVPFNHQGLLSPTLFHEWYGLMHFAGACFMFALVRELGLRRFPSLIAGICFALSGPLGGTQFLNWVETGIWLPVVFLFLLRALKAETTRKAAVQASVSGLALGLAILAGGLHYSMLQALVVLSAVVFAGLHPKLRQPGPRAWVRPLTVLAIVAGVAFAAGAPQLFVSAQYSPLVLRIFGDNQPALPADAKIPTTYPTYGLWPQAPWSMLIPTAFGRRIGGAEVLPFYLGAFPLLAAVIGLWKRWDLPWVRYLAGLAAVAFVYALGDFSAFYGIVWNLTPYLWLAREADRFMYLTHFAMAIFAAYGIEVLLDRPADQAAWRPLNRVLACIVAACALSQMIPALFEKVPINPWSSLSVLLIFTSYGLYRYMLRGHVGTAVQVVMVMLIMFDLTTFNWVPRSRLEAAAANSDAFERARSTRGAVSFLKSRPGRFRVHIADDEPPPIGDLFRIRTVEGGKQATFLMNYEASLRHIDLLNARYILKPASATEPGDLYHDSKWKVYENPGSYPPAWVVHEVVVEPAPDLLQSKLDSPGIDLRRQALLSAPLESALEPGIESAPEEIRFGASGPNRMELTVRSQSRGLLVLSEIFYPGWRATVNGKKARIHEVDGALRGVVIPRGESRIVFRSTPWSFWLGALLSVAAFSGTLAAVILTRRKERS